MLTKNEEALCQELDYCIGEFQRTTIMLAIIGRALLHDGIEDVQEFFEKAQQAFERRVASAKAVMFLMGYELIVDREVGQ